MGLGLGSGQQGSSQTNIILPQLDRIIMAWSTRRLIPNYSNGYAVKELRENGGTETNVALRDDGTILLTGESAYANTLYSQKGVANDKLVQTVFAACPKIHDTSVGTYIAPRFDGAQALQMASASTDIETMTAGYAINGFTLSLWVKVDDNIPVQYSFSRRSNSSGYLAILISGGFVNAQIRKNTVRKGGAIANNTWKHIVVTVKGAEGANGINIYVNAGNPDNFAIETVTPGATKATIGMLNNIQYLVGSTNDVILWDRELSGEEVLAVFNEQCDYYGVSKKWNG